MTTLMRWSLIVGLAGVVSACSSGGGTPTCNFDNGAQLCGSAPRQSNCSPRSPWPKFRRDVQNTGTVTDANIYTAVATNPGQCRWVFPHLDGDPQLGCGTGSSAPAKGPFAASPVINGTETIIYIGSADGTLYAINLATGTQNTAFNFAAAQPITSTAAVGIRDNMDAVFVGSADGHIYGLNQTAAALQTNWPSVPGGFINVSPTIGLDGAVYAGSQNGFFLGVCPNGIDRFLLSMDSIQSSPAEAPDGTLYFGADDHQVRSVQLTGTLNWTFAAAAPISAALVADVTPTTTNAVYVADRAGRVFKVGVDGRAVSGFQFSGAGPISSSPALAGNRLYFGSDDGNLYAIEKDTGAIDWTFPTGDAVASSPAVIANGTQPPIVVVGSNDGNVYFLQDNGSSVAQILTFNVGAPVRSSPAIGSDGTVYVGADDGRVYAIGVPLAAG